MTIGKDLGSDPSIQKLIEQLSEHVHSYSSKIEGPRGPTDGGEKELHSFIEQINAGRGRPLFYPYVGSGVGHGPYVELADGSVKLDLINGIGIHLFGHSHPKVIQACLRGALSDVVTQGNLQPNLEYMQVTKKLVKMASKNSRLKHAWLATCGTMANENALKICRQKKTPARKIIAMEAAFAGRSTLMAEVTDNPSFKVGLPNYDEVLRVPFYNKKDPASTEKTLQILKKHLDENKGNICCFTFEPMQGEGGYNVAPKEYFVPLFEACRAHGVPIWADEVQTFCRTGEFFAYEKLGIGEYIDVCTLAKTAQVGATLYTEEYNPQPGLIAGTFSGATGSFLAGLAMFEIMEKENYLGANGKIQNIHNEFVAMLNRLNETSCKGLLQDAGGLGLMIAVTPLDGSKEKQLELLKVLYKNGLMSFGCGRGPFRIRFLIPAIMQPKDILVAEKILEKSILELA